MKGGVKLGPCVPTGATLEQEWLLNSDSIGDGARSQFMVLKVCAHPLDSGTASSIPPMRPRTQFFLHIATVALSMLACCAACLAESISFNRDVRPILSENCFACHGFDSKKRKADLRLDTPEGAYTSIKGQSPIKPRDLAASTVWSRIQSSDADEVMPPPESHKKLSAHQKAILRQWIEEGALYQRHWSFEPIATHPAGAHALSVNGKSVVDSLLQEQILKSKMVSTAEARRETLIRRVAFTLTGLPPSVQEVDRFIADRSPDAYMAMLDRYLDSPHYGEEMARHWLDVARYADTHGLHLDNERSIWAYRDWVIGAFNRNLPFDQFTIDQIAGDLLPDATNDQIIATGFSRCNVTTSEGGAISEEYRHLYAVDRAATVLQTWMGLTAGCAQCHDHKYDPLSTSEFYSVYAFFFSAADPPMDGNIAATAPYLKVARKEQENRIAAAKALEFAAEIALREEASKVTQAQRGEALDARSPTERRAVRQVLFDDAFGFGIESKTTTRNPSSWATSAETEIHSGARALRLSCGEFTEDVLQIGVWPVVVPENGMLSVWVRIDPRSVPQGISIAVQGKRAFWGDLPVADGAKRAANGNELNKGALPAAGGWTQLKIPLRDFGLKENSRIETFAVQQLGGVVYWDECVVSGEISAQFDPLTSFELWRSTASKKSKADLPPEIEKLIAGGTLETQSPEKTQRLLSFYIEKISDAAGPDVIAMRRKWENARASRLAAEDAVPGTLVFREMNQPLETFVAERGQYNKLGARVEPAVPAVFHPLHQSDPNARATRLDLARWLVAPANPMALRVTVNRFWQQVFGTGLVKTSHDFGSQGEPPSHPELLDWLAAWFRESGWDVKALMRLLLSSEAFRRDSTVAPDAILRDPENRMLARGPRLRLDAEQIRDNSLFVSGLLDSSFGGRGVMPYQPPNIWEPVGYANSNTRFYLQDHGSALYRRSIYSFLKRTAPPPFMSNFDAPNREQTCSRRERTNTPMQALQLMNDVQHFEAARALAERALSQQSLDDGSRALWLFRSVLSRSPDSKEVELLAAALRKQRLLFEQHEEEARRVVRIGESGTRNVAPVEETAAWTMLANLVLNLDETVNRN